MYLDVPELLPQHVVETDASTGIKFSRHLVARIHGHAFLSNQQVQQVVETLLGFPEAEQLIVKGNDGKDTYVIDRGVYTK